MSQHSEAAGAPDQTVRAFWHGRPLTPYQVLCLRSFLDRGQVVEVFSYDPDLAVPAGVVRRDANEIWPTDRVMRYQTGFGTGSPALHANLFRYAMLHRLGGWWIDLDDALWRRIGELLLAFSSEECVNYFRNAGYDAR